MNNFYSIERNIQIVLYLLKASGIRKVIASPGITNIGVVASMQQDPFFEIYSCIDERSAAYMACGLAEESGEAVVLSCTGATASREYMPGLTEAYYRKLPIIALTSSQVSSRIGHLFPQVTDRQNPPSDVALHSFLLQTVKDANDEWDCTIKMNKALSLLRRHGGGPVHINLETTYSHDFSCKTLPKARKIEHITSEGTFPELPSGRIGIFMASHKKWSEKEVEAIDNFCAQNNAVVFCDQTSNYKGKYRALLSLVGTQEGNRTYLEKLAPDLLIHIGGISGDYASYNFCRKARTVWRVNEDGVVRDLFHKLSYVFEMPEMYFFNHYIKKEDKTQYTNEYWNACKEAYDTIYSKIPETLPFSNIWIAKNIASQLPEGSVLHLGILNSLRTWNFFEIPKSVREYSNVGGFGIDGNASTLVGASLTNKEKLFFGVFGDLSMFYDVNVLGNRNIGNNIRLLIINNGRGAEFRMYNNPGAAFGETADNYIAAAGHNGNQSTSLLKHIAGDLDYKYISASNKEEFLSHYKEFICPEITQSIIFEVFTNYKDESDALYIINHLVEPTITESIKKTTKAIVKGVIGEDAAKSIKGFIKK